MNRVYCHTTWSSIFIKDSWYEIYHETHLFYIISQNNKMLIDDFGKNYYTNFYKNYNKEDELFSQSLGLQRNVFGNFFYTEKEYNRIKGLNELLNE